MITLPAQKIGCTLTSLQVLVQVRAAASCVRPSRSQSLRRLSPRRALTLTALVSRSATSPTTSKRTLDVCG